MEMGGIKHMSNVMLGVPEVHVEEGLSDPLIH